jgi:hypothetical protein
MDRTIASTSGGREPARHVLAFAALCAAIVAAVAVSSAGAENAKVIGKTRHTPDPVCPKNCEAVGSVTGFQRTADGEKQPFRVRKGGKLVAWAIDLSRPKKSQRSFFSNIFESHRYGSKPTARLSVIKRKRHHEYKLLRQSPVVKLSGALGEKEVFTLDKPLRIKRGNIVALTVPTWASAFATGLSARGNRWRASRTRPNCSPNSNSPRDLRRFARSSRPQQRVGSVRKYGCNYETARLLYWGYYVRD